MVLTEIGVNYLKIDMNAAAYKTAEIDKEFERSHDTRSAGCGIRESHMFNTVAATLPTSGSAPVIRGAIRVAGSV